MFVRLEYQCAVGYYKSLYHPNYVYKSLVEFDVISNK